MNRYRFKADGDDYRPMLFPPDGPYWCSGHAINDEYSIVVAYAPDEASILKHWPEAQDITMQEDVEITFTDRFPKPDWWEPQS